jgi:hypothetical protein
VALHRIKWKLSNHPNAKKKIFTQNSNEIETSK